MILLIRPKPEIFMSIPEFNARFHKDSWKKMCLKILFVEAVKGDFTPNVGRAAIFF